MKKLIMLSVFFAVLAAKAQPRIAIIGGMQSTSVSPFLNKQPNAIDSSEAKRTGLLFGFIADLPLGTGSKFSIQPGVMLSAKGTTHTQLLDTSTTRIYQHVTDQKITYVDIPVHLLLKLPLSKNTRFIIGGGPQASLFYNGSSSISTMDTSSKFSAETNKDLPVGKHDQKFRVLHYSVNALAGFEIGRVFFRAHYSKGLNAYYQDSKEFKFTSLGASIGVLLGKPPAAKPVDNDRDKDGISNALDKCPELPGPKATHGCPDKDADGIADTDDRCPSEAGTLGNNGCPEKDSDGDGILDPVDKCPNVKGVAKYNGCPVPDSDGDGLNDDEDKCPTQAGKREDSGCPAIKQEVMEKVATAARQILFEYRKDELMPQSRKVLDEVLAVLNEDPTLNLVVEGHTSSDGNGAANQSLSEKRAMKVKEYLISKGIAADRITAIGYGASRPLVRETSEETRKTNRRVELKLNR
ncbi:MAG TPA: OmpA family protein [Chitinophagaceae bacterium]|nr:OmpA family protein [Chitinophagaceae bacterium]